MVHLAMKNRALTFESCDFIAYLGAFFLRDIIGI